MIDLFVVILIHDGTALGVVPATPENDDGEAYPHAEACEFAKESAFYLGCKWFDLSMGGS